jgi:hypothetical protein
MEKPLLLELLFRVTQSDANIRDVFQNCKAKIESSAVPDGPLAIIIRFSIEGFNSDRRELWDIPEAKQHAKRILKMGWYGLAMHPRKFGIKCAGDEGLPGEDERQALMDWILPIKIAYGNEYSENREKFTLLMKTSSAVFNRDFDTDDAQPQHSVKLKIHAHHGEINVQFPNAEEVPVGAVKDMLEESSQPEYSFPKEEQFIKLEDSPDGEYLDNNFMLTDGAAIRVHLTPAVITMNDQGQMVLTRGNESITMLGPVSEDSEDSEQVPRPEQSGFNPFSGVGHRLAEEDPVSEPVDQVV